MRGSGVTAKLPDSETVWRQEGSGALTPGKPITLAWDNGEGLEFRRIVSVDDKYLFTAKDEVKNTGTAPVSLHPYALISRHGTPKTEGYYILHEGLIGVIGDQGLKEETYKGIEDKKTSPSRSTNAWLGITDKYWADGAAARPHREPAGALLGRRGRIAEDLPDRLPARRADDRPRRDRRGELPPVRRRQGSRARSTPTTRRSASIASSC